jgi:hypothetical protein
MEKYIMLGSIQFECLISVGEGTTIYDKANSLLNDLVDAKSARLYLSGEDGETRIVNLKIVEVESQDIGQA